MMEITDKDLTLPAEQLLAKHRIEHGEAPAYNSSVIGLINQLTRLLGESYSSIDSLSELNEYLKEGEVALQSKLDIAEKALADTYSVLFLILCGHDEPFLDDKVDYICKLLDKQGMKIQEALKQIKSDPS